jgi:methylmalonyl-CoA mutase cobalamin-binding subunit
MDAMKEAGVHAVFTPGTTLAELVDSVRKAAEAKRAAETR